MRARTIDAIVADIMDRASLSQGDQYTSQTTVLEYANQSYARLLGKLVEGNAHDYHIKVMPPFLTVSNTTFYPLADDFWRMKNMSVNYGGFNRTIQPFMPKEQPRWSETTVPPGLTISVRYIPAPPRLQLGSGQSVDGVAGWEEWIVLDACIKAASKEEGDTSDFRAQKADIEQQIEEMCGDRDAAWPDRVTDIYERREYGFTLGVPRYRIQGPEINGSAVDQVEILWGPLPGIAFWP